MRHKIIIILRIVVLVSRYIFIKYPRHGLQWCSLRQAKIAVFLVNFVTIVMCIPNFITITVSGKTFPVEEDDVGRGGGGENVTDQTETMWFVEFKEETDFDIFVKNLNFWIQAILVKLVPCVGLTILSLLLVQTMKAAEKRRQKLQQKTAKKSNSTDETGSASAAGAQRERKTNRTTRMLLVVVVLFLLTEFPQGIINLLSGLLTSDFVADVYMTLGDLLDVLALINNGVNFILYCSMSRQFRDTFIDVFLPSRLCCYSRRQDRRSSTPVETGVDDACATATGTGRAVGFVKTIQVGSSNM